MSTESPKFPTFSPFHACVPTHFPTLPSIFLPGSALLTLNPPGLRRLMFAPLPASFSVRHLPPSQTTTCLPFTDLMQHNLQVHLAGCTESYPPDFVMAGAANTQFTATKPQRKPLPRSSSSGCRSASKELGIPPWALWPTYKPRPPGFVLAELDGPAAMLVGEDFTYLAAHMGAVPNEMCMHLALE